MYHSDAQDRPPIRDVSLGTERLVHVLGAAVVFLAVLYLFIRLDTPVYAGRLSFAVILTFCIISFISVCMILYKAICDRTVFYLACAITGAALILRIACLDAISPDYSAFLSVWSRHFRDNGGVFALSEPLGDYTAPYLYFLALISYVPIPDLYMIKLLSIAFDLVAALYAMKIAALIYPGKVKDILVFGAALFLPTVWLNSAYWAQCDSIYASLVLMSLYHLLRGNGAWAAVTAALAFTLKLQTIFFLPVFLILLLRKKYPIKYIFIFPGVYLASIIPALAFGRPFWSLLTVYSGQAGQYSDRLNLNSPSAFALVNGFLYPDALKFAGILTAFTFVCAVTVICLRGGPLTADGLLLLALVFCLGLPYLLPSMHERYFYLADLLALVYGARRNRLFIPLFVFIGSFAGYHAYLGLSYIIELRYATLLILAALAVCVYDLYALSHRRNEFRRD